MINWKKFDLDYIDKLLKPKPLFWFPGMGRKPRISENGLEYATFMQRMFAMTMDMLLLYFFLTPVFFWLSALAFPALNNNVMMTQASAILAALIQEQISAATAWQDALRLGIIHKIVFDYLMQIVLSGLIIILCWQRFATTFGMTLLGMYIADADTGGRPTLSQFIIRYIGVVLAIMPCMLGLIWVVFDKRGQGWQDKLAGTVVIKKPFRWPWQRKQA